MVRWARVFLQGQGFEINHNIIYQDNTSTELMAKHGKVSCGKRTRYKNIEYLFITDQIKEGTVSVKHCSTTNMVGDFSLNLYRVKTSIGSDL